MLFQKVIAGVWRVLELGTGPDPSPERTRDVRWTNVMGWIALLSGIGFIPTHLMEGAVVRASVVGFGIGCYGVALLLASLGRITSARMAIVAGINITVLGSPLTDGGSLGWVSFIPVAAGAFLVLPHNRAALHYVAAGVSVVLALASMFGLFGPIALFLADPPIPAAVDKVAICISLVATPALLGFLSHQIRIADHQQKSIRKALLEQVERGRALAEELDTKSQEAASASAAKSAFLANMSHEIRTPLAAVISLTSLARQSDDDRECDQYLDLVTSSADHLLSILNGILDLSKVEAGQLELFQEPCDLERLLDEVVAMVRTRTEEKGLQLKIECDLSGRPWRLVDPVRLKQILLNLMLNSVKFTESGSVTVRAQAEGAAVTFEVIDTGIGMTTSQLQKVFEPFHQAERSTTRRFGGTGLGLTVSRQLIELWQGTLSVYSTPGKCTTMRFVLDLPEAEPQALPGGGPADAVWVARPLSVLVAEDHPVNQLIIRRILELRGHSVTIVCNGQEAVEAGTLDFDLVFMDLQMPVMDGLEATRRLRTLEVENRWPSTPIIALTANAMREDQEEAAAAGMSAHMAKPVDEAVLDDLLQQTLRRMAS